MKESDINLSSDDLDKVTGGAGGSIRRCPRCQCPELTWSGRKYTCNECKYEGYI